MPDTSFLAYLTAGIYWSLIMCWSAILVFYAREYRRLRKLNPLIATLIVVIFIDGARTLIESGYFGTWYTARTGLIPYHIFTLLTEPELVLIPKALNLVAALIIIAFVVRRWFGDVAQETQRHLDLASYHGKLVEAHAELQRLEQLRDDLVDMIAHDMRTPLTGVLGSLQTALEGDLNSRVSRELIVNSIEDAQRLVAMTDDLLDLGRMESGELPLDLDAVNLVVALSEGVRAVDRLAREKGVQLAVEPPAEPVRATADAGILSRVLMNLLQNAVRHTPSGGRVVMRAEMLADADPPMARVSVADTGEGIPEEIRDRVFDRFFYAADEGKRDTASIGLGLAFCKLAVEAHGGRIWVESEVGKGSTFYFTLPA